MVVIKSYLRCAKLCRHPIQSHHLEALCHSELFLLVERRKSYIYPIQNLRVRPWIDIFPNELISQSPTVLRTVIASRIYESEISSFSLENTKGVATTPSSFLLQSQCSKKSSSTQRLEMHTYTSTASAPIATGV